MTRMLTITAATLVTGALMAGAAEAGGRRDVALVESFYQQYLHRPADACGLRSWTAVLRCDGIEAVQTGILSSDEYFCAHGHTAQGFVAGLYQDVLGRTACHQEIHNWVCRLSQCGCRKRLACDFLTAARAELATRAHAGAALDHYPPVRHAPVTVRPVVPLGRSARAEFGYVFRR